MPDHHLWTVDSGQKRATEEYISKRDLKKEVWIVGSRYSWKKIKAATKVR